MLKEEKISGKCMVVIARYAEYLTKVIVDDIYTYRIIKYKKRPVGAVWRRLNNVRTFLMSVLNFLLIL